MGLIYKDSRIGTASINLRTIVRLDNGWYIAGIRNINNYDLYFYKSIDDGNTWSILCSIKNPKDVPSASQSSYLGGMVAKGNSVYVSCFINERMHFLKINAPVQTNTDMYSQARIVTNTKTSYSAGRVGLQLSNNGKLYMYFYGRLTYSDPSNAQIYMSQNDGTSWSKIYDNIASCTSVSSLIKNDGLLLMLPSDMYNLYLVEETSANSFSNKIAIANNPTYGMLSSPDAIMDQNGIVHIVFRNNSQVVYYRATKTGSTWEISNKGSIGSDTGTDVRSISISVDKSGRIVVAKFYSNIIEIVESNDGGLNWNVANKLIIEEIVTDGSVLYDTSFSCVFGKTPSLVYTKNLKEVIFDGSYSNNTAPILSLKTVENQEITNDQILRINDKSNYSFKIIASDTDAGDTIQYSLLLDGYIRTNWTPISSEQELIYTIPYDTAYDKVIVENWDANNYSLTSTTVNSISNGIINLTSTTGDPMIGMENIGSFDPNYYRYIEFRYRVVNNIETSSEFFFTNNYSSTATAEQHLGSPLLNSDGDWHTVRVDGWSHGNWKAYGNIKGWRFDYATASGVNMEIDYVALIPNDIKLSMGDNTITVKVKDSGDLIDTKSFNLRNLSPNSLCQKDVYDLLISCGYSVQSSTSLNGLKPNGYNKSTISLKEIVEFLS